MQAIDNDGDLKKFVSIYKFHLVIFVFSFLILSAFFIDPDLGWHLAIGEQFIKSKTVASVDQFSWTIPGHPWKISYLLYQVIVVYMFKNMPLFLIGIIFSLAASCGVVFLLEKRISWIKVLAVIPACMLLASNLGIRPHVFSFLLFAIMLKFLEKKLYLKYAHVILWFLIFALWVNLHQGFLIGLLVLGAYVGIEGIISIREKRFTPVLVLCPLVGFLGTLVNPFGIDNWTSISRDSSITVTWTTIAEFQPIVVYRAGSFLFPLTGAIFIYIFIKNIKRVEPHFFLMGAFLFSAAFITGLLTFFWAAVFIFIVSRYWEFKLRVKFVKFFKLAFYVWIFTAVISLSLSFAVRLFESLSIEERLILDGYPVAAADFIREEKLTDHLFNEYSWGGYLDWQLPEAKVFIDGRMASWRKPDGALILSDYMAVNSGKCDVLKNYEVRVVLVKAGGKSKCFDGFLSVYKDKVAEVWVRKQLTN